MKITILSNEEGSECIANSLDGGNVTVTFKHCRVYGKLIGNNAKDDTDAYGG